MSYPMMPPDLYTYKQMGLVATARGQPGIHCVYQNGFRRQSESDTGTLRLPKGLTRHVKFMHVLYFMSKNVQRYRLWQNKETTSVYGEYLVDPSGPSLNFYAQRSKTANNYYTYHDHMNPTTKFSTGLSVIQADVDDSEKLMVKLNGEDLWTQREDILIGLSDLGWHEWEKKSGGDKYEAYTMEIHITYEDNADGEVFDHGNDFKTLGQGQTDDVSETRLSPGAYILWEGKAESDAEITIKDGTLALFSHKGKTDSLKVVMKVEQGRILIGEAGKPPTAIPTTKYDITANAAPGYAHIVVSKAYYLTNFIVVTGIYGYP
ncbi:uncharacterized protein LOC135378860 [Ornithodoros turicata]|uniref:uncharacterized protein LOC135378860 n=1 Tax=Ornithodoros turicata TaxID=34597 RepID=UPI003139A7C0